MIEDLGDFLSISSKDRQCQEFALRLITGTKDLRPEIDEILTKVARNWDLKRMATIDRNILRMALFEILYCEDIPPKVSINEAIELGKRFSTANSGSFINGILDRVKNEFIKDLSKGAGSAAKPGAGRKAAPPAAKAGPVEETAPLPKAKQDEETLRGKTQVDPPVEETAPLPKTKPLAAKKPLAEAEPVPQRGAAEQPGAGETQEPGEMGTVPSEDLDAAPPPPDSKA